MEFLKDILGEELFTQVAEKINAHNGNETNKDNQIKLANLAKGDYVSKGKFDSLQDTISGKETELLNANKLIEELKKASKGNDELQGKFTHYEQENEKLQEQLKEVKLKSAIKVALLSEKAVDVDYLTFKLNEKLNEKGESLEIDENDNIKGWDDKLAGLKTQFPNMFESASKNEDKKIEERKLNNEDGAGSLTRSDILKKSYAERMAIYESNPDAYREAMNK